MVAGTASYANSYIEAAVNKKIAGEGMALIIAGWYPEALNLTNPDTGLLVLVEEGTENASTSLEYDIGIIQTILERIA